MSFFASDPTNGTLLDSDQVDPEQKSKQGNGDNIARIDCCSGGHVRLSAPRSSDYPDTRSDINNVPLICSQYEHGADAAHRVKCAILNAEVAIEGFLTTANAAGLDRNVPAPEGVSDSSSFLA
jgi:hypothetical protein